MRAVYDIRRRLCLATIIMRWCGWRFSACLYFHNASVVLRWIALSEEPTTVALRKESNWFFKLETFQINTSHNSLRVYVSQATLLRQQWMTIKPTRMSQSVSNHWCSNETIQQTSNQFAPAILIFWGVQLQILGCHKMDDVIYFISLEISKNKLVDNDQTVYSPCFATFQYLLNNTWKNGWTFERRTEPILFRFI